MRGERRSGQSQALEQTRDGVAIYVAPGGVPVATG